MRLNEENALLIKAKKNYGTYDVSGKSFKVNQLVDFSSVSTQTINGLTITNNNDGSLTISGTATAQVQLLFNSVQMYENHKYLLFGCASNGSSSTYALRIDNPTLVDYGDGAIGTASATNTRTPYLMLRQDVVFNNLVFKPRYIDLTDAFGTGNEPTTLSQFYATPQGQFLKKVGYIPYTLGKIIDSQSQYEFSGRNLYDKTNQTLMHTSNFISVLPNTTYRCLYDGDIANGCYWNEYDISKNTIIIGTDSNPNHTYNSKNFTFTTGANTYFVKIHLYFNVVRTNEQWLAIYNSMQLQLSTETETSYTPYFKPRKLLAQLPNGRDEHYSRNVFDGELEGNGIDQASGISTPSANAFRSKNYINVVSGQYYTFGWNTTLSPTEIYLFEYDSNKTFIRKLTFYSSNTSKLLSTNTQYVRFCFIKGGSGWATNVPSKETAQILLQLSTETDTSYIPHIVNANYQELEYIESSGTRYTKTYQYVPCYRKLDLAIGLYDLTNDTFTAYSGTKGREIRHTNEIIKLGSLLGKWNKYNYETRTNANLYVYNGGVSSKYVNANVKLKENHKYLIHCKITAINDINYVYSGMYQKNATVNFTNSTRTKIGNHHFNICSAIRNYDYCEIYIRNDSYFEIGDKLEEMFWIDLTACGLDTLTAQQFYDQYHDYLPLLASGLPPIYKPVIKLLSAGTAHDVYRNTSGKITENIGVVDLGDINYFVQDSSTGRFGSVGIQSVVKKPTTSSSFDEMQLLCADYSIGSVAGTNDNVMQLESNGALDFKSSAFIGKTASEVKTLMKGKILRYGRNSSLTETLMQKIESVDLSTLTWYYDSSLNRFYATIDTSIDVGSRTDDFYCSKYATDISSYDASKTGIMYHYGKTFYVQDHNYTDPTSFKNSLSGIYLTYITTQTEPIPSIMLPTNATKCVDNNGVEMGMVKR